MFLTKTCCFILIFFVDGGKLEVWDISTGENLQSIHPYEEAVTGLKVFFNFCF
jgi:hypothetical protein